jgi:8-oxo-dGTP pyrophosphatase MutT (NUDIX family)
MSAGDRRFEPVDERTVFDGKIFRVTRERFRYPDGDVVEREIVRQPREAIDDPDFLEIPAGRLDQEGESPLEAAKRELAEEIGKAAARWEPVCSYVSAAGILDEVVHIFHATGLSADRAETDENERIEIVKWPLSDLDGAIAATRDAKTLIGLQWLRADRG